MTEKSGQLKEAIDVLKKHNEWRRGNVEDMPYKPKIVGKAIDTVVAEVEKPPITERDMHLNMQYYMEYCQMKGYVTPMEWIENHKHF